MISKKLLKIFVFCFLFHTKYNSSRFKVIHYYKWGSVNNLHLTQAPEFCDMSSPGGKCIKPPLPTQNSLICKGGFSFIKTVSPATYDKPTIVLENHNNFVLENHNNFAQVTKV